MNGWNPSSAPWRRGRPAFHPHPGAPPGTAERGYLYCGPSGAGHFAKMVHNGIEYGLMQAFAEGFDILRNANADTLPAADPCVIVIFGATGDLTRRKLLPALFHLACEGCMAPAFHVVGVGRQAMDDDAFRDHLRASVAGSAEVPHLDEDEWRRFAHRLSYLAGDIGGTKSNLGLTALATGGV